MPDKCSKKRQAQKSIAIYFICCVLLLEFGRFGKVVIPRKGRVPGWGWMVEVRLSTRGIPPCYLLMILTNPHPPQATNISREEKLTNTGFV